ncbi:hypothetical protein ACHAXR_003350, partial [Thalassiosira sp. AJA248-18]
VIASGRSSRGIGGVFHHSLFTRHRGGGGHATASSLNNNDPSDNGGSPSSSTALHQTSSASAASSSSTPASASAASINSSSSSSSSLLTSGHIAFRLARRTDVPQIANCNLATLPENYNANFYVNHMRKWPELTLVAEHIPEGFSLEDEDYDNNRITPLSEYIRGKQQRLKKKKKNKPRKEIVGYVLGKVEERPIHPPQRSIFPPSSPRTQNQVPLYEDEETLLQYMNGNSNGARIQQQQRQSVQQRLQQQDLLPKEKIGHITSLAVHTHARRLGIASSLLHQLQYHLYECYGANSVGLHVRISNKAAVRLYCEDGYDVSDIIPCYYGDGEDAYFMRKDFDNDQQSRLQQQSPPPQAQEQPEQQGKKTRRGEKERNECFRTFFNYGGGGQLLRHQQQYQQEQQQRQQRNNNNQYSSPPWEIGPEGLRLPRYSKVLRKEEEGIAAAATNAMIGTTNRRRRSGGVSLKDLVTATTKQQDDDYDNNYDYVDDDEEEEEEGIIIKNCEEEVDARVASGSL